MPLLPPLFSPLDDALGLLPGSLSPQLWEGLLRLASTLPFAQAVEALQFFWRVFVSDETARRLTEHAGAAYVDVQAAECARIRREMPEPPTGPAVQQLSLDGALVHATDGQWVEVKTAVIGDVAQRRGREGESEAHATALSYFSRADPVERFTADLLVEVERRGDADRRRRGERERRRRLDPRRARPVPPPWPPGWTNRRRRSRTRGRYRC